MRTIAGLLRLFIWNSGLRIQQSMEYRADFILGMIISLSFSSIGPVVQYLIFTQTKGYPGWTAVQIVLFQGVILFWVGIRDMAFGQLRSIIMDIFRKGDFDRFLLKPYPPIGILLSSSFSLN